MSIHATAIVDPSAHLGEGVSIGPYSVIGSGAVIGDGTQIGSHAVVHSRVTMGLNARVHSFAVIGDIPQDLGFKDVESRVIIGDHCIFREGVTIHRGTAEGSVTEIGNHVFMMANSHAAHNVKIGDHAVLANGVLLAGHVEIGERVFIGGNAAIHQYGRIGRMSIVGGLAGITKDVLPFSLIGPVAQNRVGGLNLVGMKRAGLSPDERKAIKAVHTIVYHKGLNASQAAESLRALKDNPFAGEFAAWIETSKRGICRFGQDGEV